MKNNVTLEEILTALCSAYRRVTPPSMNPILKKQLNLPENIDWSVFNPERNSYLQKFEYSQHQAEILNAGHESLLMFQFIEALFLYYQTNQKLFSEEELIEHHRGTFKAAGKQAEIRKEAHMIWQYYLKFIEMTEETLTKVITRQTKLDGSDKLENIIKNFTAIKTARLTQLLQTINSEEILSYVEPKQPGTNTEAIKQKITKTKNAPKPPSPPKKPYKNLFDFTKTLNGNQIQQAIQAALPNDNKVNSAAQTKLAIDIDSTEFAKTVLHTSGWTFFTRPKSRNLTGTELLKLLDQFSDDETIVAEILKHRGLFGGQNFWKKIVKTPNGLLELANLFARKDVISQQIKLNKALNKKVQRDIIDYISKQFINLTHEESAQKKNFLVTLLQQPISNVVFAKQKDKLQKVIEMRIISPFNIFCKCKHLIPLLKTDSITLEENNKLPDELITLFKSPPETYDDAYKNKDSFLNKIKKESRDTLRTKYFEKNNTSESNAENHGSSQSKRLSSDELPKLEICQPHHQKTKIITNATGEVRPSPVVLS